MSYHAPYEHTDVEFLPELIDYNGHMNLAYYIVLFDQGTDALFDALDLGLDYRRKRNLGTFVAEMHTRYERELLVGERVRGTAQLIDADANRLYVGDQRFRRKNGLRSATVETILLHVSRAE